MNASLLYNRVAENNSWCQGEEGKKGGNNKAPLTSFGQAWKIRFTLLFTFVWCVFCTIYGRLCATQNHIEGALKLKTARLLCVNLLIHDYDFMRLVLCSERERLERWRGHAKYWKIKKVCLMIGCWVYGRGLCHRKLWIALVVDCWCWKSNDKRQMKPQGGDLWIVFGLIGCKIMD